MAESAILDSFGYEFADGVNGVLNDTFIIAYGIIKEVKAENVVSVEMSVAKNPYSMVVTDCYLVNFMGSTNFGVHMKPKENDKVLVFFPKDYTNDMFDLEKAETIFTGYSSGYSVLGGLAVLCNTFTEYWFKNTVVVDEGKVNLKLAYDKDSSTNKFEASVAEDGSTSIKTNNTSVTVDSEDNITVNNGKAEIKVDSNGNVTIDAKSGKISIKNSVTDLYSILNGMLQILNTSLATAGSPASHTVVPQQFAQQSTQLGQLME